MMYSIEYNINENVKKDSNLIKFTNKSCRHVSRSVLFVVKQNRTVTSKALPVEWYSQREKDQAQPLQKGYPVGRSWKEILASCQEAGGLKIRKGLLQSGEWSVPTNPHQQKPESTVMKLVIRINR